MFGFGDSKGRIVVGQGRDEGQVAELLSGEEPVEDGPHLRSFGRQARGRDGDGGKVPSRRCLAQASRGVFNFIIFLFFTDR